MNKSASEVLTEIPTSTKLKNAEILSKVLSETYGLFLKTQVCHWNVTGPLFISLHLMFEEQYREMFNAIDEIAERIRSLGEQVPVNFLKLPERGSEEETKRRVEYPEMIRDLSKATELTIARIRQGVSEVHSEEDAVSHDLLIRRLTVHEKNLWMLQSFLL